MELLLDNALSSGRLRQSYKAIRHNCRYIIVVRALRIERHNGSQIDNGTC